MVFNHYKRISVFPTMITINVLYTENQLTSKASTSGSDHKQATSKLVQAQNPYNLEVGSLVHFGDPLKCGVIKWIGIIPGFGEVVQAGLKMVSYSLCP